MFTLYQSSPQMTVHYRHYYLRLTKYPPKPIEDITVVCIFASCCIFLQFFRLHFSAIINQPLQYYDTSVCLQENDELLFGVELFAAEEFSPFVWELVIWAFVCFLCWRLSKFLIFFVFFVFYEIFPEVFPPLSHSKFFFKHDITGLCFNFSLWSLHFWALVSPEYSPFLGRP